MPTTANKAFRYPVSTDTPDVPRDIGYLASDVDAAMVAYEAAWTAYTPNWSISAGTAPSVGNGTLAGRWKQIGKLVVFHLRVVVGSTTSGGSGGYWLFSAPTARSSSETYDSLTGHINIGANHYVGVTVDQGSLTNFAVVLPSTGAIGPTSPSAYSVGSTVDVRGVYESA